MIETALDTLITYNPWTLAPATPLAEAARLLDESGVGAWPIVDESGALLGKLTTIALARALRDDATGVVASGMDAHAISVELNVDARDALALLVEHRQRMFPVIDGGRVVGTLSTGDFLREMSYGSGRAGRELVVDHLDKSAETIDADAELVQSQAAFDQGATHLVVVQGDFPLGAMTPISVARAHVQQFARAERGAASAKRTLGQCLVVCPTIAPGRSLAEAAGLMVEHQLDALAVTNQAGTLIGVVTERHLLLALLA